MRKPLSLKVLVYGATGSQASPLVHELVQKGHQPIAVTHSPTKGHFLKALGAEVVEADLKDRERLVEISKKAEVVSLLIPFFLDHPEDGLQYAKNAIDAAKEAHIRFIVFNTSTVLPTQPVGNPAIDTRREMVAYLKESGIPYVVLQPTIYTENLLGPWSTSFVKHHQKLAYPFPEEVRVGWISSQEVACFTLAALERPELAGSTFCLSGVRTYTGSELAAEFSDALQLPISYYPLKPKEFGLLLDEAYGVGAGEKVAQEYQRMWDTQDFPHTFVEMEAVMDLLQVTTLPMKTWVREHSSWFVGSTFHQ